MVASELFAEGIEAMHDAVSLPISLLIFKDLLCLRLRHVSIAITITILIAIATLKH